MTSTELANLANQWAEQAYSLRHAHVAAKEQVLAAEHQLEQMRAEAYCQMADDGVNHCQIIQRLARDQPIQQAELAKDRAELAVSRTWAEYERASSVFRIALALLQAGPANQDPFASPGLMADSQFHNPMEH